MSISYTCWLSIIMSMVFYAMAEYASKKWTIVPGYLWYWSAVLAYLINIFFWLKALKIYGGLAVLSTIYSALFSIVAVLVGVYVFGEILNVKQWIGIIFAIVAVILLG